MLKWKGREKILRSLWNHIAYAFEQKQKGEEEEEYEKANVQFFYHLFFFSILGKTEKWGEFLFGSHKRIHNITGCWFEHQKKKKKDGDGVVGDGDGDNDNKANKIGNWVFSTKAIVTFLELSAYTYIYS